MSRVLDGENFGANPLYQEVKQRLTQGLAEGEWKPGTAIPSETKLSERFGVSIGTIRKAIDDLVADKILMRLQGRGTFVATHNHSRFVNLFFRIVGPDGVKQPYRSEFISFREGQASVREASQLGIKPGDPVFRMSNLLWLDEEPIDLDRFVIPQARFPGMTEEIFRNRENTIYGLYQSRYGITVLRSDEMLHAVLPDPETARVLRLPDDQPFPLLQIDRVAYTFNDQPVELRTSMVNTAHHRYQNKLGNME